jgi:SAM-dependent methyltransferase
MAETPASAPSLLFRHVVQARLEALFQRGAHLLHVGCGTGEETLALAARGIRVVGIDSSPEMIHRARKSAAERGLRPEDCRFEVLGAENADAAGAGFDGAYASFDAPGPVDLRAVGAALAATLRGGAGVVLRLPGPWPLPAVIRRTLTGVGDERRPRAPGFGEARPAVATPAEARTALGAAFEWTDSYALGVLVPGPAQERWAADHPQTFGLLAALERAVRRWPGLRQLGDLSVLEGRRREPA